MDAFLLLIQLETITSEMTQQSIYQKGKDPNIFDVEAALSQVRENQSLNFEEILQTPLYAEYMEKVKEYKEKSREEVQEQAEKILKEHKANMNEHIYNIYSNHSFLGLSAYQMLAEEHKVKGLMNPMHCQISKYLLDILEIPEPVRYFT